MKILFYFSFLVLLFSCDPGPSKPFSAVDSARNAQKNIETISTKKFIPELLDSIFGDFDGDGKKEFAILEMSKDGYTNLPAHESEDSAAEFKLIFRNEKIKPCAIPCCDNRLVKEEDLDGDGSDEISVMSNEGNGCSYLMFTYTLKNGNWKELLEPFVIMTGCDPISDSELQARIFRKNGKIYYLDVEDVNSSDWKLVKKIAVVKK